MASQAYKEKEANARRSLRVGRPLKLTPDQERRLVSAARDGVPQSEISKRFGVGSEKIRAVIAAWEAKR